MGVDTTAVMAYGTEDASVLDKLSMLTQETSEGPLYYFTDGTLDASKVNDLTDEQRAVIEEFQGFTVWFDQWNDEFEGFGIDGRPNSVDETRVEELFKKYELGEPDWVSFVHYW